MNTLRFSRVLLIFIFSYFTFVCCQSEKLSVEPENNTVDKKEDYNVDCEERMQEWLNFLCSSECAGRYVGTEGSRKASDYIVSELTAMGFEPTVQEFKVSDVNLRNIVVIIPGSRDSCIVIGAHYDGQFPSTESKHYPAANDNASGVVTLLRIALDLSKKKISCPYSLYLCFWDGEENTLGKPFKGSSYYVNNFEKVKNIKYYQNIDSVGHDHRKSFRMYYYGDWVVQCAIPYIQNNYDFYYTEVAFRDKGEGSSDYVSFSKQGVSFLNIVNTHPTDCRYHYHSVADTPDAISISLLSTMADIAEKVMLL